MITNEQLDAMEKSWSAIAEDPDCPHGTAKCVLELIDEVRRLQRHKALYERILRKIAPSVFGGDLLDELDAAVKGNA